MLRPRPAFCNANFSAHPGTLSPDETKKVMHPCLLHLVKGAQFLRRWGPRRRGGAEGIRGEQRAKFLHYSLLPVYSCICLRQRWRMGLSVASRVLAALPAFVGLEVVFDLVKKGKAPWWEVFICWSSFSLSSHVDNGINFLWAGRCCINYNAWLIHSQVALGWLGNRMEIGTSSVFFWMLQFLFCWVMMFSIMFCWFKICSDFLNSILLFPIYWDIVNFCSVV